MAQINRQSGSDSSLPSAALPASGSRGLQPQFCRRTFSPLLMRPAKLELDSQPSGSPAIFHAKLRLEEPKSTRERVIGYSLLVICKKIAAATAASTPNIAELRVLRDLCGKILLRRCLLFYIRMEDRHPSALFLLPDRAGVVSAGSIFAVKRAFNLHRVGGDDRILSISRGGVIADGERFHLPLFHVGQLLLHVGDALCVRSKIRSHPNSVNT